MKSAALLVIVLLMAVVAAPQPASSQDQADLIANAMSAAPVSVSAEATIVAGDGTVLREGSNGWVCMPDDPAVPGNSPMCLDGPWREVIDAWLNHREPEFDQIGFSYMLQGDFPVSNTDPFATEPTADNQWLQDSGPHLMIVYPDHAALEGISTDPGNGGPYVMWKGSPYAHVMVPMPAAR